MNAIGGAATFGTGMGLASAYDNQSVQENTFNSTQKTKLDKMTAAEQALSNEATGLGLDQSAYIRRLLGDNMFALSPQEMEQLNAAYAGSEANLRRFGGLMGQDLAATRGLNTSDTPVSEAVLREVLPAMAALQGEKMQTGLGFRLQNRALQLQGANSMPAAMGFNLQKLFNERLATGRTTTSGSTRGTFNPGFLDRLATASGAQKNFTSAGADLAGGTGKGTDAMMGGVMNYFSDVRLKQDITPVSWKWKNGDKNEYLGVVAQEIEKSHPHLVEKNEDGHLMVNYGAMVAMLLDERTHLYAQLDALRKGA